MQQNNDEQKRLLENTIKSLKNKLELSIYVYGNQFDRVTVYKWLTVFRFFKPTRIRMSQNGQYSSKRYSESVFKEAAFNNKVSFLCLENTKNGLIEFEQDDLTASFRVKVPLNLWIEQKAEIIDKYQEIFIELGGCFGFAVNCFDNEIIQNPWNINIYKSYKVSDSDFPGINNIPIIRMNIPTPYPMYQIDSSYLPGHRENYGKIAFTVAPYMWFGPDFNRFFSQEKLDKYNNCHENNEFAVGYRRVCLWEDIAKYNASLYRERQWDFLKELEMKKIVKELNSKPFISNNSDYTPDPSIEIQRGNFSHGGTLLAKFYVDKNGKACSKSVAYAYIQREMQGHTILWQEKIRKTNKTGDSSKPLKKSDF